MTIGDGHWNGKKYFNGNVCTQSELKMIYVSSLRCCAVDAWGAVQASVALHGGCGTYFAGVKHARYSAL